MNAPQDKDPDPDATVVHRVDGADPDATVMQRPVQAAAADPDATFVPETDELQSSSDVPKATDSDSGAIASTVDSGENAQASGLNALVAAANPLLLAVPQFRWTVSHSDPAGLRDTLLERLTAFEETANAAGERAETVTAASIALCSLIDEAVLSTPWGSYSDWDTTNLLRTRHGEPWAREEFFALLEKLEQDPAGNLDLLELFCICLALGYEGRYRDQKNARAALTEIRDRVSGLVRAQRGLPDAPELSLSWKGAEITKRKIPGWLAFWVVASSCVALLGGVYLVYRSLLSEEAQPVYAELARMRAKPVTLVRGALPAVPVERMSKLLAEEIRQGLIQLREDERTSVVTINATELFASGSASVESKYAPIVLRIGKALHATPGSIVVTGHTDSRPIRTARFPSNWELSSERAASVVRMMAPLLAQPGRMRAEGVADSEPVAPNDTEQDRRKNRRVVVILSAPL
ncbi:MAG: type VI secretion system protein TssL [Betaproteobacteria bacterium]|nr:type VI secretion system protein TssL [Betaproteobacteria bacterium]